MKIGILTFHRAHNYGAVLQCYALQEVLKSMGHEVWIIDYRQPHTEKVYKVLSMDNALNCIEKPIRFLRYFKNTPKRITRKKHFESFNANYLHITKPCTNNIPTDFDCYIIGSDQLWSKQCLGGIFDEVFLGSFKRNSQSKLIGYAISSNQESLNSLEDKRIKTLIENFSLFSMREERNAKLAEQKTGVNIDRCLDPTLLTNTKVWDKITNSKWANEDYILIYQVRYPLNQPKYLEEKADELSKQFNNCKVINISSAIYSVEDFLSLFKYAKYVVTTSFHATVFSVVFETPFYAIKLKDGHDDRYENLLNQIGANEMCVDMDFKPIKKEIDFRPIKEKLKVIQEQSLSFLKRI